MTALSYSKVASLPDFDALEDQTHLLQHYPTVLEGQHAVRAWEYSMAVYTIQAWKAATQAIDGGPLDIGDVGGAGSNFWQVLAELAHQRVLLVDPNAIAGNPDGGRCLFYKGTLEEYVTDHVHGQLDILTCISVIEHLDAVRPLFRAAHMLLKRGGLLFLTTDCWDSEGPDAAHFHWMRKRIYNVEDLKRLRESTRDLGFRAFGTTDWHYRGATVYDYSVASLALVKR
jgi:SAM-dependent methyltransferase